MHRRKSIFNFNHIDKNIDDDELTEIKSFYKYYHKTFWCYKKAFKYFRIINLISNIKSTGLTVTGTIAGGVTLNPTILGTISGVGLLLKIFSEIKNYKEKIEMCKFAFTKYEKYYLI